VVERTHVAGKLEALLIVADRHAGVAFIGEQEQLGHHPGDRDGLRAVAYIPEQHLDLTVPVISRTTIDRPDDGVG
jgi:hypothetical protein